MYTVANAHNFEIISKSSAAISSYGISQTQNLAEQYLIFNRHRYNCIPSKQTELSLTFLLFLVLVIRPYRILISFSIPTNNVTFHGKSDFLFFMGNHIMARCVQRTYILNSYHHTIDIFICIDRDFAVSTYHMMEC